MAAAFVTVQILVVVACLLVWAVRLFQRRRTGSLLPTHDQQVSPLGIVDIAVTVFVWLLLQLVAFLVAPLAMGINLSSETALTDLPADVLSEFSGWVMLSQVAATLIAIAYFLLRHRKVRWLEVRNSFGDHVIVGLVGSLMLIPVVMSIQMIVTMYVPYTHPTVDSLIENFSGRTAMWAWISAVGGAPLVEEFFFRGVMQGWLQRIFDHDEPHEITFIGGVVDPETARERPADGSKIRLLRFWAPIVITSVVFACMHLGQGPAPIPLFFLSLGIGYIFRQTGSFVPCFVIHLLLNGISMTVLSLGIVYPELMPPQIEAAPAMMLLLF